MTIQKRVSLINADQKAFAYQQDVATPSEKVKFIFIKEFHSFSPSHFQLYLIQANVISINPNLAMV
jgi:hypothetical protein